MRAYLQSFGGNRQKELHGDRNSVFGGGSELPPCQRRQKSLVGFRPRRFDDPQAFKTALGCHESVNEDIFLSGWKSNSGADHPGGVGGHYRAWGCAHLHHSGIPRGGFGFRNTEEKRPIHGRVHGDVNSVNGAMGQEAACFRILIEG
jgi:hypothetical protein